MKRVYRLSMFALWMAFSACLPQGGQTGGIVPGGSVMGAAADAKSDSSVGNASTDEGENRVENISPANTPPPTNPTDVVASAGPNPMPAGTAAPIHEVPDAFSPFLEGEISRDCRMPDGKTSVHVRARLKKKQYVAYQAKMYELSIFYKQDASETGFHTLVTGFQQAPDDRESVTTPQAPVFDYVDFSLPTSDPDDLHYYLEAITTIKGETPMELVPLPPGRSEVDARLTDLGPAVPPACYDVRMMMGRVKPEGEIMNFLRTRE